MNIEYTYNFLERLANEFGTPFYIMNNDAYLDNLQSFRMAFISRYDKLIIGYSFKTNYVPALCKIAKEQGCYAEVVSDMEYTLAKKIGFEKIIFNGPIKNEHILIQAIQDKAIVNLDSWYEVETILKYKAVHPKSTINVGLRLNIDLTGDDGLSRIQCGLRVGRFGFPKNMVGYVIDTLRKADINIVSLHGHTSSSDRAVSNYVLIANQMLEVCSRFCLNDIQYFDIGGGFSGAYAKGVDVTNRPSYHDYANGILDICLGSEWFIRHKPFIVIEPGVSVVANVFDYIAKIYQTKDINGQRFLTTDGTVFDVKPTLHSSNIPYTFFTRHESSGKILANLVGSTCMEKDVILNNVIVPSDIEYNDYVLLKGVGAYTIVLTPSFINYKSPIIGISQNGTYLVRRRETINDIVSLYNI